MYERTFYFFLAETRDVFYAQTDYVWRRKCRTSANFFDLYIFLQPLFFSFLFFFPSKIVQSTRTPVLLPDRHLILSDSIRKPGTVTPQFSKASKTVYLLESGILEFCASLLYQRIITEVNLSPSELWCFWWMVWLWSYVIYSELLSSQLQ